tara:strand:- start:1944 stop:3104 length:1161 start_codon:yes stop_codon:yes gene_type:complete
MANLKITGVRNNKNAPDSWEIWYMDLDGKRIYETVKAPTKSEAFKIRQQRQHEIESGSFVMKDKITVDELFDIFTSEYLVPNVQPVTLNDYIQRYNLYVRNNLGKRNLQDIKSRDIFNLYSNIRKTTNAKEGTLKIVHAYIRKMFNFAVDLEYINRSPMAKVSAPKADKEKFTVWTPEQVEEFLNFSRAKNIWTYFPMALTVMTGLRRSEVLGLKWEDVDFARGVINLTRTVHEISGQQFPVIQHGKTAKAMTTIPVPVVALNILKEIQGTHISIKSEVGNIWNKEGWVFVLAEGSLLKPNWLTTSFRRNLEKLNLPKPMNIKGFRHLFATFLLQKNAHPKVVQELMRHSTFKLTMDTYSHVVESIGREAVSLIDEVLNTGAKLND